MSLAISSIQSGFIACQGVEVDLRAFVINVISNPASGLVATAILHLHASYSNGLAAITGNKARDSRVGGIIQIIHIHRAIGICVVGGKKEIGSWVLGASSVFEEIFGDASRLACDDGGVVAGHGTVIIKSALQSRHRLLGGAAGKHLSLGLRGVVARGGLLCAGGREEGRDDRGEQHDHEQRENER